MMIKSLLRLIFVLVYKSTSPWSKSKKKGIILGGVLYFLMNCLFLLFFCLEIFLWSEKMGIILQLL